MTYGVTSGPWEYQSGDRNPCQIRGDLFTKICNSFYLQFYNFPQFDYFYELFPFVLIILLNFIFFLKLQKSDLIILPQLRATRRTPLIEVLRLLISETLPQYVLTALPWIVDAALISKFSFQCFRCQGNSNIALLYSSPFTYIKITFCNDLSSGKDLKSWAGKAISFQVRGIEIQLNLNAWHTA